MAGDALYTDFFSLLNVTFKNASIYHIEHPAYVKSVEDLKAKLDALMPGGEPLVLGFSPHALIIGDRTWEGERVYRNLARIFHFRKIKSLAFSQWISLDELRNFISRITLPPTELFSQGGVAAILEKEKIQNIKVEELDYSQLLKGEGEEISDIWTYLMKEAVAEKNDDKIMEAADSFESVVGQYNTEELIVNEELQKSFADFFSHLKTRREDKYRHCAKNLVKSVVTHDKITTETKFDNLKLLISDLSEEEMASTLWEEIITDDEFDSLSFSVFSKLMEKDRHLKISTSLRDLFQDDNTLEKRPEVKEKIQALLSGTSSRFISEIYRNTLSELLKEISYKKKTVFDHKQLQTNYRYVCLNWLDKEGSQGQMLNAIGILLEEWDSISTDRDYEFLKYLWLVLEKKKQILSPVPLYQELCGRIIEFIENSILDGESSPLFDDFIALFPQSFAVVDTYLNKIFDDQRITVYICKALFRFHKEYLSDLHRRLDEMAGDSSFLGKLCLSLGKIDLPITLIILKRIFKVGGIPAKIQVLKTMQELTEWDEKFALSMLRSREGALVGEALVLLMRDEKAKQRAFEKMLSIESPYGLRNRTLLRNIRIIRQKNLHEARRFLEQLSRRGALWNRKVRDEVRSVLEQWDA